jgi:hypothetical protein
LLAAGLFEPITSYYSAWIGFGMERIAISRAFPDAHVRLRRIFDFRAAQSIARKPPPNTVLPSRLVGEDYRFMRSGIDCLAFARLPSIGLLVDVDDLGENHRTNESPQFIIELGIAITPVVIGRYLVQSLIDGPSKEVITDAFRRSCGATAIPTCSRVPVWLAPPDQRVSVSHWLAGGSAVCQEAPRSSGRRVSGNPS